MNCTNFKDESIYGKSYIFIDVSYTRIQTYLTEKTKQIIDILRSI